jgi:peptidoglycan hydrolase-like protein with peptidoglycan-binding domain
LPRILDLRRVSEIHLVVGPDTGMLQGLLAAAAAARDDGACDPGPVDRIGGPRTRSALLGFQRAAGLVPDAICGPDTWARLLSERERQDH